jgi:isoquinoline 1-oxidoreductase beta subunit
MVYAVVRHAPSFGATLAATPATPSGMLAVVPLKVWPGSGTARGTEADGNVNAVAVVGSDTWTTWQAAKAMSVKWNASATASSLNSTKFLSDGIGLATNGTPSPTPYVAGGTNPPGTLYTVEGSATLANGAIAGAAKVVDAQYTLPYVAHACMEVLNCTVDYVPGVKCDIYAPTQSAKNVLALAKTITGLPESAVTVYTTYLGGGLGRKAEADFVSEAIQVGMAVKRPVKLMWPREEDFTRDQYRPMAVVRVRAGINSSGNVLGWAYRNVSPSLLAQRGLTLGPTGDSQGIEGANALPYLFANRVSEYVTHPSPIPVGFWRSVGASVNTFCVESMIDELALAAGQDPYTYRRTLLTDPRWVNVLDQVAMLAGWFSAPPSGRARGIAIGTAFKSIVAQVVECSLVSTTVNGVTTSTVKVNNVSIAIDSYVAVNPGQIEAQLVGGMVHGMNAALYGRQTFSSGAAQNRNFTNNRMIRLQEMPAVKVYVVPNPSAIDSTVAIGGAGELGVPTFAPALANAYAKLTGTRIRTLPFYPSATMGGL